VRILEAEVSEAAVDRRERIQRSISLACVVVVASTSVVWRWSDRDCVRGVAVRNAEVWLLLRSRAVAVRASLVQRRLEEEGADWNSASTILKVLFDEMNNKFMRDLL
jgi:hypothetical protein